MENNELQNKIAKWNQDHKLILCTNLENARSISEKYKYNSHIIRNGHSAYWVVTPGVATVLEANGYQVIGVRGHMFV